MDRDPELPNYDLPINSISVVLSDGKNEGDYILMDGLDG